MGRKYRKYRKRDASAADVLLAVIIVLLLISRSLLAWALLLIGILVFIGYVYIRYKPDKVYIPSAPAFYSNSREPANAWTLDLLHSLDWKRFEELCLWYLQEKDFNASIAGFGPDGGVDIKLYESANPSSLLGVAQCKAWTQKAVGVKEIRELLGVMTDLNCPNGIFFAMSGFSPDAQAFAANKSIDLISATQLLDLIAVLPAETKSRLLDMTTQGGYTVPSCPSCGIKLVLRTASKGFRSGNQFWGCHNYPRCKYIMNI